MTGVLIRGKTHREETQREDSLIRRGEKHM